MVGGPELIIIIITLLAGLGIVGGIIAAVIWAVRSAKGAKDTLAESKERQAQMERDLDE